MLIVHNKKMKEYLIPSTYIDFDNENVSAKAAQLSAGIQGELSIVEACYKFVRDEIRHSELATFSRTG